MKATEHYSEGAQELVNILLKKKMLKTERIIKVMLEVDRNEFMWEAIPQSMSYLDRPMSIDYSATISAPHMHAYALEKLKDRLKPGGKALDVGSGSGILTVMFAKLMEPDGVAYGIEHIPELVEFSMENINKSYSHLIQNGQIKIVEGDGRKGLKEYAPFDVIHVGAAAESVPQDLIDQLAPNGIMMIPVGPENWLQQIYLVTKDNEGKVTTIQDLEVRYVPLTSKDNQYSKKKKDL